jgi:hypothetical protein
MPPSPAGGSEEVTGYDAGQGRPNVLGTIPDIARWRKLALPHASFKPEFASGPTRTATILRGVYHFRAAGRMLSAEYGRNCL